MPVGWYVIDPPMEGVLSASLKKAVANIMATNPTIGDIAASSKKFTVSLLGRHPVTGSIVSELDPALAALAGAQIINGQLAAAIKKTVYSAMGGQRFSGTVAAQARKAIFTANGMHYNNGVLAVSATKVLAALNAAQIYSGVINASTPKMSASISEGMSGSMASSLKKLTVSLTAQQIFTGGIASIGKKPTANLAGGQTLNGSLAAAMKKLEANLSGGQRFTGTGAATLKKAVASIGGTIITSVSIDAVGSGGYTNGSSGSMSCQGTQVVNSGPGRRMIIGAAVTHSNWLNTGSAMWPTVTTDQGDTVVSDSSEFAYTQAAGGQRQGYVYWYYIDNPTVGTHTLTATKNGAAQFFNGIRIVSISLHNALGDISDPVYVHQSSSTSATFSMDISSDSDHLTVLLMGRTPSSYNYNQTEQVITGANASGYCDYLALGTAPGNSPTVNHASTTSTQRCAIGLDIAPGT